MNDCPNSWQLEPKEQEMAEFALDVPTEADIADAITGIGDILELDDTGEVDLSPYLVRLLLQLEELLTSAPPNGSCATNARNVGARVGQPVAERGEARA